PEPLQVQTVYGGLNLALDGPRHQVPGPRIQRLPAIRVASSRVASDVLNPAAFEGTGGNPGKKNTKELFKRVGIPDIFAISHARFVRKWGAPVATSFIGDKLEEIVQRRHKVAHRADALTISRVALRESERFLRVLSEVLDIEMGYHIRALCRNAR
ncbi:MAG TPA: HEPN domain-containing protein, partial [Rubricoccaceae bacterium]|nr:HEPN domain-containing protein [Rubricoccaceae bacterium]